MISRTLRLAYRLLRVAALEDRIQLLAKKYPKVPVEDIQKLSTLDPTGGKYLEWLVRQYPSFKSFMGDMQNLAGIRDLLVFYQKVTRSSSVAEYVGLPTDISKLHIDDLHYAWQRFKYEDLDSQRQKLERAKKHGSRVIYDKGGYYIIQVGGSGTNVEDAALAACLYAKGTKWCTSDLGTARKYLTGGPLYIVIKDGKKVLQTDLKQFVDDEGMRIDFHQRENFDVFRVLIDAGILKSAIEAITVMQFTKIRERVPEVEKLVLNSEDAMTAVQYAILTGQRFKSAESLIASDAPAALWYAVEVLKGPFPMAEGTLREDPLRWNAYQRDMKYLEEEKLAS